MLRDLGVALAPAHAVHADGDRCCACRPLVEAQNDTAVGHLIAGGLPGAIQAAGRIALEVERDKPVTGRTQRLDDAAAFSNEPRDLIRVALDSCHVAVM